MKNIFLCSSFKDVAPLFEKFMKSELTGKKVSFIPTGENKGAYYTSELTGKKVSFIPTGSYAEKVTFYVDAGREALEKMGLVVDELDISTAKTEEITFKLQHNDFIYVTGGNTFYLLQELKKSGADQLIKEQILKGKIYIGESAGSMILSPNIEYVKLMDDVKKAPDLQCFYSLGVIDFYPVPHYTNFPFVKAVEKIIAQYGDILNLCPITNNQAILISDEDKQVVTKQ